MTGGTDDRPPASGSASGADPQAEAGRLWRQLGTNASGAGFFVGLFTTVGTFLLANTLAPDAGALGKVIGSLLLGAAAGLAVFATIASIREAVLPRPPTPPRPAGKVEV